MSANRPTGGREQAAGLAAAALLVSSCNAIFGIDALEYRAPTNVGGSPGSTGGQGGSAAGGAATSQAGSGGAGASGGHASGGGCAGSATRACYDGPAGTEGEGECHGGEQTCVGGEWGPCEGQQLPATDVCGNDRDEDCDGAFAAGTLCLTGDSVVVRYFIDEADSGTTPVSLLDASPSPLALSIDYATGLTFCTNGDNRGLCWTGVPSAAVARAATAGTKVEDALDDSTAATWEAVVDIDGTSPSTAGRIAAIAAGCTDSADFSLGVRSWGDVYLAWHGGTAISNFPVGLFSRSRIVLHVVFDSMESTASERVRLYINGGLQSASPDPGPDAGDLITISSGDQLTIGNCPGGDTPVLGAIFYAALYDTALSDEVIATNATILAVDDDLPL